MTLLYSKDSKSFSFACENLSQRLAQESDLSSTGYWRHQLRYSYEAQGPKSWYLGLLKGKAIFSGDRPLSTNHLLTVAKRYIPRMKSGRAQYLAGSLQQKMLCESHDCRLEALPTLLTSCYRLNLFTSQEIEAALRLVLLQDLDEVLFDSVGRAEFLPESDFSLQSPEIGFDLRELLAEARRRRVIWDKVKALIPSLETRLAINEEAVERASLAPAHRENLQNLISHGETIKDISESLCQDSLSIAKGLAQLVHKGLLAVRSAKKYGDPEILIIDDSPLMLQMFQTLVSSWGYKVRSHADPTSALEVMAQSNPIAIFLDINMPKLSGFDLLKQIRRQPEFADVPLIMLTAERTLSNNWRAQWSGCKFLSKPLSLEEIPEFKAELRMLLEASIE